MGLLLEPERVYADALHKMRWHMQRGNDEKANEWAILAAALEHCYGLKRPQELK